MPISEDTPAESTPGSWENPGMEINGVPLDEVDDATLRNAMDALYAEFMRRFAPPARPGPSTGYHLDVPTTDEPT